MFFRHNQLTEVKVHLQNQIYGDSKLNVVLPLPHSISAIHATTNKKDGVFDLMISAA